MKLTFDGKTRQYSPAAGLDLFPGEHDYPEDKVEQLLAIGLKEEVRRAGDRAEAPRIKVAAVLEGKE